MSNKTEIEIRTIKFYLDKSVNKRKKDKILKFLKECQDVENQMLDYYWHNFDIITRSNNWMQFSYDDFKVTEPSTKSHHHQQIKHQVYNQLKSIQTRIKNLIRFKFEDNEKQRIYNYFAKFCFEWDWLKKHVNTLLKNGKKKDKALYDFLVKIQQIINDENAFKEMIKETEEKFYEIKQMRFKQPVKKEFQIWCNKVHVIKEIKMKEFQWVFVMDSNKRIGGTEKKGVFDRLIIPVKFSKYHKEILENVQLNGSFNIKLNRYGRIEIAATYKKEVTIKIPQPKEYLGVDIGLNKLIATSDGEFISQNKKLVNLAKRIRRSKENRNRLTKHLRDKYEDNTYRLPDKNYKKLENKLVQFVKCDNRRRIKRFLQSRMDYHIIREDLMIAYEKTLNKETNYLLRRLRIQQLVNDLEKYCKNYGIKISKVNPSYTSQQCSVCGFTSKTNRKTQEKFSCQMCDNEMNADVNAAINIMNRYFDKRILLETPNWRIKEILGVNEVS